MTECPEYTYEFDNRCYFDGCPAWLGAIKNTDSSNNTCVKAASGKMSNGETEVEECTDGWIYYNANNEAVACYSTCLTGLISVNATDSTPKLCREPSNTSECKTLFDGMIDMVLNNLTDKKYDHHIKYPHFSYFFSFTLNLSNLIKVMITNYIIICFDELNH